MHDKPDPHTSTERYRGDRFELQPAARRLIVAGHEARIGARAFDVLLALVERPGRVVGKEELLAAVWPGVVVEEANLSVQISALRKLLGPGLIATVAGRGYQFTGQLQALQAAEPAPDADDRVAAPPRAPTPMFGRAAELAALSGLLATQRLVTVTGPGGIGKTRLAQAWCEGPGAGERIAWLDLGTPVVDAAQLAAALPPRPAADQAATWVLDNAEAVAAVVAAALPPLLSAAPRLRLLVTSQVPLQLHGEQVFRLGTLPVPPPRATPAEALGHSAVQLFVERARAADPRFELAAGNVTSVVEICRRLDGLPLALELAAARVATIGVNALAAALGAALDAADGDDAGLALLGPASRDKPERQRTLQAALTWSHALLDPAAQRMFRRLGIFAGGFTLAAAQAVVGDDAGNAWNVMNTLGRLVEHSLVAQDGAEPPRFRLLDAARLFALTQLERAQETATLRQRHLAWCTALVETLGGEPDAPLTAAALARTAAEAANWRAALEHAFAPGSPLQAAGARLVAALQPYWRQTDAGDELRRWSARAAAAPVQPGPAPAAVDRQDDPFDTVVEHALAAAALASARGEAAAAASRFDAALAQIASLEARWLERAAAARRRLLDAGLSQALRDRDAAAAAARIEALGALELPACPTGSTVLSAQATALLERGRVFGELFDFDLAARLTRRRFDAAPPGASRRTLGVALVEALNGVQRAGGDASEDPLALCEDLLAQTPRATEPATWAALQHERARTLGFSGARSGSLPTLDEAIAACGQALQLRTRERQPAAWADSMALLAALQGRAAQFDTGTARLQAAVAAARASLEACSRSERPLDWARTQSVIASALSEWARREGSLERSHEAVAAYRSALGELSPEQTPRLWGAAQTNLAIELAAIGAADPGPAGLEALQAAVDAYRAALHHLSAERTPGPWAATQHNLGGALRLIGEREPGTQSLREAALAFAAALQLHTRERAPQHWAAGQNDRALALLALGRREGRAEPIAEAVAALRDALLERRRETAPVLWARTSGDLADALLALGQLTGTPRLVQEALATAEAALAEVHDDAPDELARLPALIEQARGWLATPAGP